MSGKKETKQIAAGPHFSSMTSYQIINQHRRVSVACIGEKYHLKTILGKQQMLNSTGPVSSVTSTGPRMESSCSRAKDSMADADLAPS